jgi:hypothetical protein
MNNALERLKGNIPKKVAMPSVTISSTRLVAEHDRIKINSAGITGNLLYTCNSNESRSIGPICGIY